MGSKPVCPNYNACLIRAHLYLRYNSSKHAHDPYISRKHRPRQRIDNRSSQYYYQFQIYSASYHRIIMANGDNNIFVYLGGEQVVPEDVTHVIIGKIVKTIPEGVLLLSEKMQ